jgi:hypothetical protein
VVEVVECGGGGGAWWWWWCVVVECGGVRRSNDVSHH